MRAYSFLSLVGFSKKHNVIDKKIVAIEGVNIENTFSSRFFIVEFKHFSGKY